MCAIQARKAKKEEIEWVNSQYKEVGFVASNFYNEFIAIVEVDGRKAGLGRLVIIDEGNIELGGIYVLKEFRRMGVADHIVDFLCTNNSFKERIIWCLPFEHLKKFYEGFGFKKSNMVKAPKVIARKHEWCNTNYDQIVLLLAKTL